MANLIQLKININNMSFKFTYFMEVTYYMEKIFLISLT